MLSTVPLWRPTPKNSSMATSQAPQPYLQAVVNSLPTHYQAPFQTLLTQLQGQTEILDVILNFVTEGDCPPEATSQTRTEWNEKQLAIEQAFRDIRGLSGHKRSREEYKSESQSSKRPKIDGEMAHKDDPPLYTLHAISVSSPIRKKVNITIHASSVAFTHPTTHALEAIVPLSSINRAFLLPTRGKQKPHWTVVLLSGDVPDRGKASSSSQANQQIIFGLDAVTTSSLTVTRFSSPSAPSPENIPKGKETLPCLRRLLSHLPTTTFEPSTEVFRSALPNPGGREGGISGVEGYLAAKPGTLWFLKEGILWGEGKPCEFWAVGDLSSGAEGVRLVSATGRTCTVILSRKIDDPEGVGEDEVEETEFAMVDGREQEGIKGWVRRFRSRFGQKAPAPAPETNGVPEIKGTATKSRTGEDPAKEAVAEAKGTEEDDESDESFEIDTDDDDGGSATSDSGSSDAEDGDGSQDGEAVDDEEEELRPENHPLMRAGAMPKMSRAAMDAVVGMMEDDMMGSGEDELY
jgi:hypothetical protein